MVIVRQSVVVVCVDHPVAELSEHALKAAKLSTLFCWWNVVLLARYSEFILRGTGDRRHKNL